MQNPGSDAGVFVWADEAVPRGGRPVGDTFRVSRQMSNHSTAVALIERLQL
jgi:hypothetical protein